MRCGETSGRNFGSGIFQKPSASFLGFPIVVVGVDGVRELLGGKRAPPRRVSVISSWVVVRCSSIANMNPVRLDAAAFRLEMWVIPVELI